MRRKLKLLNPNQTESLSMGSRSVIAGNRGCTTSRSRTPSVLSDHYSTLSPIRECPEQIKVKLIMAFVRGQKMSIIMYRMHSPLYSLFQSITISLHRLHSSHDFVGFFKTFENLVVRMYRTLSLTLAK